MEIFVFAGTYNAAKDYMTRKRGNRGEGPVCTGNRKKEDI